MVVTYKVVHFRLWAFERSLDFAAKKICLAADIMPGIYRNGGVRKLPTKIQRWTVNRSPFTDKKSREQFERRTHFRLISVEGEPAAINKFKEYVIDNLHASVSLKVKEFAFESIEDYSSGPQFPYADPKRLAAIKSRIDEEIKEAKMMFSQNTETIGAQELTLTKE
jgi:small subunit ribosomal protein S10